MRNDVDYLTKEQVEYVEAIEKCDNVLKNYDMRGFKKGELKICEYANEVSPELVVQTFKRYCSEVMDGGGDPDPDFYLVIFHANAKLGFLSRLVAIQERENAVFMD